MPIGVAVLPMSKSSAFCLVSLFVARGCNRLKGVLAYGLASRGGGGGGCGGRDRDFW